ncbi:hypothetical protein SEA_PCORAL7_79 [Gordonia phage PCoral7]|uniref:Uncharacterized protein n=1 Tax=Gordonia phage Toast TaxID=2599852 RepID=A0A5J6TCM4_9CAUD|nr:hypothetical protein JZX81_gp80 [Gordonia phage Toast]QFG08138.1 hypothetical protein PBI_TOAST_80 [Gordonia phage Toast]UVF60587.1 hypothetical protein SEA_PCORAL7_79 [Gordonia phage PCoral7]
MTELETQVAKLQGVTESLNLELGTERQDHTAARDALHDILKTVTSEQFPAEKVADIIRILDELGYHEHVHVAYTTSEPDNATH